jgi:hypothetical protein
MPTAVQGNSRACVGRCMLQHLRSQAPLLLLLLLLMYTYTQHKYRVGAHAAGTNNGVRAGGGVSPRAAAACCRRGTPDRASSQCWTGTSGPRTRCGSGAVRAGQGRMRTAAGRHQKAVSGERVRVHTRCNTATPPLYTHTHTPPAAHLAGQDAHHVAAAVLLAAYAARLVAAAAKLQQRLYQLWPLQRALAGRPCCLQARLELVRRQLLQLLLRRDRVGGQVLQRAHHLCVRAGRKHASVGARRSSKQQTCRQSRESTRCRDAPHHTTPHHTTPHHPTPPHTTPHHTTPHHTTPQATVTHTRKPTWSQRCCRRCAECCWRRCGAAAPAAKPAAPWPANMLAKLCRGCRARRPVSHCSIRMRDARRQRKAVNGA